ncbi:MAG: PAS domain S-box protein, partial [Bryobacteraceae bacterium]
MVQRLGQAPENSLVVTTLLAHDHNGDYLPRAATLRRLAAATSAPVWTMASDRVGHGILGGNASLGLRHGKMTAAVALDVLYGHAPAEVAVRIDDRNEFLLDYGEMRRWKIPEASLPDDVVVVNRPFSFLRANRVWILAGLGFLAAQTLIIAALVASILRRRRAETLLARQRQALEQSRDGIVILSPEGEIQYANSAIARMFGYAEGEMAGRPLLEPGAADTDGAREQTRKDGSKFMARFSSSPLHNSKGVATGVVSIVRDITLERALEERVHHAQKMDCVGRLAGGIAHDFNNMLTVINGYSAQVLAQVAPGGPVAAGVAEIRKAGERASSLTRQLLAFSRRDQIRPAVLDLNAELNDVAGILRHLMGGNVDLVLSPGPNLGRVRLDP